MNKVRHFKSLLDINKSEFIRIIERSIEFKKESQKNILNNSLQNKTMAMIFKKNSTRTRVAFETAMATLGGHAIFLSSDTTQMTRGEDLADTAKVLSGMVDIVMIRTHNHSEVEELARLQTCNDCARAACCPHSQVPRALMRQIADVILGKGGADR